jgi:prepilin peptidase CpaA
MLSLGAPYAHAILMPALVVAGLAAAYDWRTGHIPNWLTLGALGLGCLAHALLGIGQLGARGVATAALSSLLGLVVVGLVPLLLYRLGSMGGGDVKLLAALGVWCWAVKGIELELYAFVIAALYAGGHLAYRGQLLRSLRGAARLLVSCRSARGSRTAPGLGQLHEMRFAPSVFAATCCVAAMECVTAC